MSTGTLEPCQGPDLTPRKPTIEVPRAACDCHAHVFGDPAIYPYREPRRYTPAPAYLDAYRHMLATLGIERAVIVQPAIYTNNQVTIDALKSSGGKWRGIALLDARVEERELEALHAAGFRGVRFHPGRGNSASLDALEPLCARIAPFGWHVQFHLDARDLVELGPRFDKLPVPYVIDHIGHMAPASSASISDPGFVALRESLARGGCWVKVSAVNRFGDPRPPYPSVAPFAQALIAANADRVVWGSDWPHTSHSGYMPNDAELLDLLALWAPDPAVRRKILVDNPARLYGFD